MVIHADGSIDTKPTPRKRGVRLARLAMLGTGIVRTEDEHVAHTRYVRDTLPALHKAAREATMHATRSAAEREHAASLAVTLRELTAPVFGVRIAIDDTTAVTYYVSADVLVDWRHEYGPSLVVVSLPVIPRHGMRGLRLTDAHNASLEFAAEQRANERGLGIAQNAWRYARLEGDADAMAFAYAWLWHGSLEPCRDHACELCQRAERNAGLYAARNPRQQSRSLARQHAAILAIAAELHEASRDDMRRPKRATLARHRMPAPQNATTDPVRCAETYGDACKRLGMAKRAE